VAHAWTRITIRGFISLSFMAALALVVGRALPAPPQLVFWQQQTASTRLLILDSLRALVVPLARSPDERVVDVPRLSRDGQRVVFETAREGRLHIFAHDRQQRTLYHTQPGIEDRLPALSPDGRWLAFWSSRTLGANARFQNWHLLLLDLHTGEYNPLTEQFSTIPYAAPMWSPDGRRLTVSFWRGGSDEGVYVVDLSSNQMTSIRPQVGSGSDLSWSPDGERLAFRTTRDGNPEIYLLDLTTGALSNLTRSAGNDFQPAWSPDAQRIAFVSTRGGRGELYLMNADGSDVRQVTQGGGWQPGWSPSGALLAYTARDNADEAIYITDSSSANTWRVLVLQEGLVFVGWYRG
jgi:TolB protein